MLIFSPKQAEAFLFLFTHLITLIIEVAFQHSLFNFVCLCWLFINDLENCGRRRGRRKTVQRQALL